MADAAKIALPTAYCFLLFLTWLFAFCQPARRPLNMGAVILFTYRSYLKKE
jgi:hypothetical protein